MREAIDRINTNPDAYLSRDGVGKGYVCPVCGSGSGKNGTGITSRDGRHFTCWAGRCFTSATVFDILAVKLNIDPKSMSAADYERVLSQAGIPPTGEGGVWGRVPSGVQGRSPAVSPSYLAACAKRAGETAYFEKRGISKDTVEKYALGYDPAFKTRGADGFETWQAVVIPTGGGAYVLRNVNSKGKDDRIRKRGEARLFNEAALYGAEQPVFVVEGEFDALSIIEVGGMAVGLGSVANVDKLIRLLEAQKPCQPLILALDNDASGEQAASALIDALDALGVPFDLCNVSGAFNDPNEALVGDRETFTEAVRKAAQNASQAATAHAGKGLESYRQAHSAARHLTAFWNHVSDSADTPATPTGFRRLDAALDGGLYEGLYILGAVSSLGKTTFVLQLADQVAEAGRDALIFSLEMSRYELMAKSLSRLSYILAREKSDAKTARGITDGRRYGAYREAEHRLIGDALRAYDGFGERVYIREGMGEIGASEIREAVETHVRLTGNRPLVVVDYLQLLQSADPRMTDKQNVDKSVLELKRISRDFKIPLLAISSFNRENYRQSANMAAFKESGAIEYSSDVLLALQPLGVGEEGFDANEARLKNPRQVELVVLKNRNGQTGARVPYDYCAMFNHFLEIPTAQHRPTRRV